MRFTAAAVIGFSAVAVQGAYAPPAPVEYPTTTEAAPVPVYTTSSAAEHPKPTADKYTTEVVTAYTTYCPEATQITHGGVTYSVTSVRLFFSPSSSNAMREKDHKQKNDSKEKRNTNQSLFPQATTLTIPAATVTKAVYTSVVTVCSTWYISTRGTLPRLYHERGKEHPILTYLLSQHHRPSPGLHHPGQAHPLRRRLGRRLRPGLRLPPVQRHQDHRHRLRPHQLHLALASGRQG
jgi:hypothetical protein